MNQSKEYSEISLKDILFYILRRWKPIFAITASMALLLGGFYALREYQASANPERTGEYLAEYQQYQEELALHEDRVAATQAKIDTLQDYMDHSILMQADYRNVYIAKATYYIDSDYKIMPESSYQDPDKTYTLTWYYQDFLQDYGVYEEIGRQVGIEAKYLMELISVQTVNDSSLALSVSHPYEQSARQIMEALQEKLYAVHGQLDTAVDEHTLTLMLNTCGVYVDESLKDSQQKVYDDMLAYQGSLIQQKQELNNLAEGGGPTAPDVPAAFIKGCILGGISGGALAVAFLALRAFFSNRVYFSDGLVVHYNVPVLGSVMRSNKKPGAVSRWLRRLEGRLEQNNEENIQFLAANILNHCGDAKKILVCSDISTAESRLIADSLCGLLPGIRFSAVGSLTREAGALKLLPNCDAVMLAVTGDKSRNKDIGKALSLIQDCGKPVIGFVFID